MIVLLDPILNWTDSLKTQGPLALLILGAFIAGSKKSWYFGHQVDTMQGSWTTEKVQLIKDRDIRYGQYEAEISRMKSEQEGERGRIKTEAEAEARRLQTERERAEQRAQKYEEYTFRLLEAASSATKAATSVIANRSES